MSFSIIYIVKFNLRSQEPSLALAFIRSHLILLVVVSFKSFKLGFLNEIDLKSLWLHLNVENHLRYYLRRKRVIL